MSVNNTRYKATMHCCQLERFKTLTEVVW